MTPVRTARTARTPAVEAQTSAAAPPQAEPMGREQAREPSRDPGRPLVPGRAVGLNRAGKPIQRVAAETGVNEFFIPPHLPPPGWSWEWKEETVLGQARQGYAAKLASVGWEAVMTESYPGIFTPEYDDRGELMKGPIRRGGLILMERAMILTQEAMLDEKRKADEKVGNAKHQYRRLDTGGTQTAEFDQSAQQASYIRTQTVQVASPTNPDGRQPID